MPSKAILLGMIALCAAALCAPGAQAQDKKSAPKVCWKTPPAPWFDTRDCPSRAKPQILSTGEFGENRTVVCKNIIMYCGQTVTKYKTLEDNLGRADHCPVEADYTRPNLCCAKLEQAIKSKKPCDPLVDANCDGTPDANDRDPLYRRGVPQDYIWVDAPAGDAFATNYLNQKTPLAHCTRLKMTNHWGPADGYAALGGAVDAGFYSVDRDRDFDYSDIDDRFISCTMPASCRKSASPPSCGDSTSGFVFVNGKNGTPILFKGPSTGSPVAGKLIGTRVIFKETAAQDGRTGWYHVFPLGAQDGWVRAEDVTCTRRASDPAYKPSRLVEIGDAHHAASGASASTTSCRG